MLGEFKVSVGKVREYLSSIYGAEVTIEGVGEFGRKPEKPGKLLKGFGYGVPYLIEFTVKGERKSVILETIRPGGFGHEHFSDRAQILLWQHSAFNKLPRHVRSVDVGAFTVDGGLKSVGDCVEFFILTEKVEGEPYHRDLDRVRDTGELKDLDVERCRVLSDYLVEIHRVKRDEPGLYVRRIRDLLGHGECIMGLTDSYPPGLEYIGEEDFVRLEKKCVEWRWKLKRKVHRLSQVHGDFHPWNVLFREGTDFTVLDRSRGEWGEPADDVSSMSINYIFYSLQQTGRFTGPFKHLFNLFMKNYLDETGDDELLTVIQPFYTWRALVVASPVWYPHLSLDVRVKLLNFARNVLETERFDLKQVESYMKD